MVLRFTPIGVGVCLRQIERKRCDCVLEREGDSSRESRKKEREREREKTIFSLLPTMC